MNIFSSDLKDRELG
jgi:hypothetical protein